MNSTALPSLSVDAFDGPVVPAPSAAASHGPSRTSVLAWPAWQRALAVAPALLLLWLAVAWAMAEVAPL